MREAIKSAAPCGRVESMHNLWNPILNQLFRMYNFAKNLCMRTFARTPAQTLEGYAR